MDDLRNEVPRSPHEFPFLFGEGTDLEFIENVERDEVIRKLTAAVDKDTAPYLALMVLDGELPEDIRREAATEFGWFLAETQAGEHVQAVLYGRPLPASADLPGALDCCRNTGGRKVRDFFERLHNHQPEIDKVFKAFQGLPANLFGSEQARTTVHDTFAKAALCRDLVLRSAVGMFLVNAFRNPEVSKITNHRAILKQWVADFPHRLKGTMPPRIPAAAKSLDLHLIKDIYDIYHSTRAYFSAFGHLCDAPTYERCKELLTEVQDGLDSLERLAERNNRLYQHTCDKTCKRLHEKLYEVFVLLTRPSRI
jgi:hypothetical protein